MIVDKESIGQCGNSLDKGYRYTNTNGAVEELGSIKNYRMSKRMIRFSESFLTLYMYCVDIGQGINWRESR